MYDHIFYKQVQISRSDIRPHIKWAVSLVILHMVTSIFLQALCGYIWVNILTLSPRRGRSTGIRFLVYELLSCFLLPSRRVISMKIQATAPVPEPAMLIITSLTYFATGTAGDNHVTSLLFDEMWKHSLGQRNLSKDNYFHYLTIHFQRCVFLIKASCALAALLTRISS